METEKTEVKPFTELMYSGKDVEELIKKRFPQAQIVDASDYIHTERFEVTIEDITTEEFYPWAISEGIARECFGLELRLQSLGFPGPRLSLKDKMIDAWRKIVGKSKIDRDPKKTDTSNDIRRWIDMANKMI